MRTERYEPHDPDTLVARWLAAEQDPTGNADDVAEAALLEMFESLPPLAPRAGFADRVLRRVALEEAVAAAARRPGVLGPLVQSRAFRFAVACGIAATAFALLWVPELLLILGRLVSLGDVMGFGAAGLVDAGRWLTLVARLGEWLLIVGQAFAVSLMSPAALKVTAACLAISGISIVALRDLMTRNRSWSYVDSMR
jgi:hypothetical protein